MEFKDLVPILVQIVLIPLLTALTGVAVKWINSKANELSANTDNIYLRQVIGMLNDSISTAVEVVFGIINSLVLPVAVILPR